MDINSQVWLKRAIFYSLEVTLSTVYYKELSLKLNLIMWPWF